MPTPKSAKKQPEPPKGPSDPLVEKGMPSSPQAEQSVLGAIILDNHCYELIADRLHPDDFAVDAHRRLYSSIRTLRATSPAIPVDCVILMDHLLKTNELAAVGGISYISDLTNGLPRSSNIAHYARIVQEKATLRRMIYAAHSIVQEGLEGGYDDSESVAEGVAAYINRSQAAIMAVNSHATENTLMPLAMAIASLNAKLDGRGKPNSVPTGFEKLDQDISCGGWPTSEYNILAARPQHGKTSIMLAMAYHAASSGIVVAVFSLETTKERLLLRLCCQLAGVSVFRALHGYLNGEELRKISDAQGEIADLPLYVDDGSGLSPMDIMSRCRRLKAEKGLGEVWIDFIQLVRCQNRKNGTRHDDLAETNRLMKDLAKELQAPVIALSQLTRETEKRGETGRPQLRDLKESGSFEEFAYLVLAIHREDQAVKEAGRIKTGKAEVLILKDKDGPTGVVELAFEGQYTRFSNIEGPAQGRL